MNEEQQQLVFEAVLLSVRYELPEATKATIRNLISSCPYSFDKNAKTCSYFFNRYCNNRITWWIASGGTLWSSKERVMFKYSYARDYCYEVFNRWARIYKLPLEKQAQNNFVLKVSNRYGWFSKANVHYVIDNRFVNFDTGTYSNVEFSKCNRCGSNAVYGSTKQLGLFFVYGGTEKEWKYAPSFNYLFSVRKCSNTLCDEAFKFMAGVHDVNVLGKTLKIGISAKAKKLYRLAETDEERSAIASAELLDYSARIMQKQDNLKLK